MNLILFLIPALICCSSLNAMEKEKDKVIDKDKIADEVKQKKSSALEKAALKASQIAARNGHKGLARAYAKFGDPESPTLAVHQSTLTKDPEKKAKLVEKAALLNPHRPSAAKEQAAQSTYDTYLNQAHVHFKNAIQYQVFGNKEEARVSFKLFEEELLMADTFYRELLRVGHIAQSTLVDEKELEIEVKINNLEMRYTWELESISYFTPSRKEQIEHYLKTALAHFEECYTLKYPALSKEELSLKIKSDFDPLKKEAFSYEEVRGSDSHNEESLSESDEKKSIEDNLD